MAEKDLNAYEIKFEAFLQSCINDIDKAMVTLNDTVTKVNTTRLKVPRGLVVKLDKYYSSKTTTRDYADEFTTGEFFDNIESISDNTSEKDITTKGVEDEDKSLFVGGK